MSKWGRETSVGIIHSPFWRRTVAALFLLTGVLLAITPATVRAGVLPPPSTVCPNGPNPPVLPGSTPISPGVWWNPNHNGVGWTFNFTSDHKYLIATWYTFTPSGTPIWLSTPEAPLSINSSGEQTWSADLQLITYNFGTHTPSGTTVGSVAVTFVKNSTTAAAIQWQWNTLGVQSHSECLYDYFRGTPPPSTSSVGSIDSVNESFTGLWYAPSSSGWGLDLTEGIDGSAKYTENPDLELYDSNGQPVWIYGQYGPLGSPPPTTNISIPLFYAKSNYGSPTTNCSASSCISLHSLAPNSYTRSFVDNTGGIINLAINVPSVITGGAAFQWPPVGDPVITYPTPITKLTDGNEISVSSPLCQAPPGQQVCSFQVSWTGPNVQESIYRRDLNSNQLSGPIASGLTGQITESLTVGSLVRYELLSGGTQVANSASVQVIAAPSTGPSVPDLPQLAATPSDDLVSDGVGSTAGQFSVDQSGNSQYRIPLYAPHGAGGLTPNLALVYNSGAGDGILGYGWQLEGLSAVAICRMSQEHGDGVRPVGVLTTIPSLTAYCLDGQRMDLVSGVNGAAGAVYRLENDSATEIVIENASTIDGRGSDTYAVPTIFAAYAKDGTVRRFGTLAAELRSPWGSNGATLAWYEYEIRDSNNNRIAFNYSAPSLSSPAALVPSSITYSGGEIDFAAVPRPSTQQSTSYQVWVGGAGIVTQPVWLTQIAVKANGATLRTYTPTYSTTSVINPALEEITSLQECAPAGAGPVCYPPVNFAWANISDMLGGGPLIKTYGKSDGEFSHVAPDQVKFADVDGDGRTDTVFLHGDDGTLDFQNFLVAFSAPSKASGIQLNAVDICNNGHYDPNGPCPQLSKFLRQGKSWQLLDFDGDGRSDLLMLEPTQGNGDPNLMPPPTYRIVVWKSAGGNVPNAAVNPFTQKQLSIASDPQTAQLKPMTFPYPVDTFVSDFDGDGLPDLLTVGRNSGAQVWLLKPTGNAAQPYAFQGPYIVRIGTSQNPSFCGIGSLSSQTLRTADFNGDGRADLVLRVSGNPCASGAVVSGTSAPAGQINFLTVADFDAALAQAGGMSTSRSISISSQPPESVQVFTSGGVEGGTGGNWFDFLPSGLIWQVGSNLGTGSNKNMVDDSHFQVADINGDGLTDMMFAGDTIVNNSSVWLYELNQGGSRGPSMCVVANSSGSGCAVSLGVNQTQLGDYDGDGKADFWTVEKWAASGSNTSVVHLWTGNGFSTTPIATNLFSGDIGTSASWFGYLVDLDGDGHPDSLEINPTDGGGAWQTARNSVHHQPRNVVQTITSGLGAVTTLTYAPLTYTSLYYREYNASSLSSGWGSPVQDVLTPRYVVQYADSSAPTDGSPGAISTIRYQYSGFKMQGGGRGSLGFDKVYTTDAQTGIETVTAYNQAFPLTGTPSQTAVYTNGSIFDGVCAPSYGDLNGDPDSQACMAYGTATDLNANQQQLSLIRDSWSWHVFGAATDRSALAGAAPIFVFRQQTQAVKHDLDGTLLSSQATAFNYNPIYGEVLSTISNEYSQAIMWSGNLVRQTNTVQTYQADVDIAPSAANAYAATWHVGRLTGSTTSVTGFSRESVNPAAYPTRTSSFKYDPVTGQLTEEHLQSGGSADQALTKYHVHDAFGNEVQTVSCSDSTISQGHCSSALTATQMTFDASDPNWVQRYTRTGYDASGIYPTASYAPFSAGGVGAAEHATLTIDSRDAFGNPTQTTDAHGVRTVGGYGAFGRPYFSATNAGAAVQTIYRWCAGHGSPAVSCPAGAAYRVDTNAGVGATSARAPESWVYYDVLARVVLNIKQGLAPTDFIAVSTTYDNLGRVHRISEPYFTSSPTSSNVGAGAVYFTTSYYDSLGRVTLVTHPNGQQTTTSFGRDALGKPTTTVTLPPNVSGYAEQTVQTRNHLGELITVADSLGSTLNNTYDAAGNLLVVTRAGWDGKGASAKMGYDAMGRKISLNDPDAGSWTYAYNAVGEEVQKISATTCEQTFPDGQGRPWSRSDYASPVCGGTADASATWSYDTATSGVGELTTATSNDNGTLYTRQHAYDGFGRINRVDTTISSGTTTSYTEQSTYDPYGRPFQTLFSGNGIPQSGELYQYNPQGYHDVTRDAEYGLSGPIYLQTLAMDARGHVTQEERANNSALITARTYTPDMGRLSDIVTAGGAIQKLHYDYDALGNVEDRRDTSGGAPGGTANIYETYAYDPLQRLTTTQFLQSNGSTVSSTNAYDSLGNFQSGTYGGQGSGCTGAGEVAAGPDAIVTIGSNTFCYDAHGNQTRSLDPANSQGLVKRQQSWSAFDALRTVDLANWYISHTTKWAYGPEHQRLVRQDYTNATGSGPPNVIHYVGNAEIITAPGSTQRIVKRYLPGLILSQTVANNATQAVQYEYLFTDNLGSTHRITDANGAVATSGAQAWGAFGAREDATTGAGMDPVSWFGFDPSLTRHGFTGHEQMDETDLIHMNGRVYDPRLARFIQADPFVQNAGDLQSYNRYSYLMNNPLGGTDPSGYWGHRQQGYVREAAAIAIAVYTGYYYSPLGAGAGASAGEAATASVISGYTSGFIASGNLNGALMGAFSAGINYAIGSALPFGAHPYGNVAAHAIAGGVLDKLQGGNFGHGFITSGITAGVAPNIDFGNTFADGVAVSVLGGTTSAIAGGKFANGALTAAFEYSFNELLHYGVDENGNGTTSLPEPSGDALANLRTLAGFVPFVDIGICAYNGCSTFEWSMAALSIVPVEGKEASLTVEVGASEGATVFRVWGDEAGAMGRSWTTVNPLTVPNYRNVAGLPAQNSGRFVSEGVLTNTEGVATRGALPLHGNVGGLPEVVVPNPAAQIRLKNIQGLNPEL